MFNELMASSSYEIALLRTAITDWFTKVRVLSNVLIASIDVLKDFCVHTKCLLLIPCQIIKLIIMSCQIIQCLKEQAPSNRKLSLKNLNHISCKLGGHMGYCISRKSRIFFFFNISKYLHFLFHLMQDLISSTKLLSKSLSSDWMIRANSLSSLSYKWVKLKYFKVSRTFISIGVI